MNALSAPASPSSSCLREQTRSRDLIAGFTLTELLVAMTIMGLVMGLTLVAYTGVVKRAFHTESTIKGSSELRYATDFISQSVRSAAQLPTVSANGLQLTVPPEDFGVVVVEDTTWIDQPNNVKGSKANQRVVKFSNYTGAAVTMSIFSSVARPTGAVAAGEVATYFKTQASLPVVDLNTVFSVGDSVKFPATAYGGEVTRVINSISQNAGQKTVTFTQDLSVDIPSGTRILATSGRRMMFEVRADGNLRYYPDSRDTTKFTVLARDVDPSPLTNPAVLTSGNTTPFVLNGGYLTINLQKLPRGTMAGRTVQGVQTTVLTRTNPSVQ